MEVKDIEHLRFPVGRFQSPKNPSQEEIDTWISEIENLPNQMRLAVAELSNQELDIPYRSGGWTAQQVVHHVADSHMNAYIRFKLALTEDSPNIKPYDEASWAKLPDTFETPIEISLKLVEALHQRWTILLKNMSPNDYKKIFLHPEHGTTFRLDETIAAYAWHGKHHLGHINIVKQVSTDFSR